MNIKRAGLDEITEKLLKSQSVEIRDVDNGQDPFVYSIGNRGPGYIMIKGLVGRPATFNFLIDQLALKVVEDAEFDFIEGNVTGGMIPGWQLRNVVSEIKGREIPFAYLRGARKAGGHDELLTGDHNNPYIKKGYRALVVEDLTNYAGSTVNAANTMRDIGYRVDHAATIFAYDHTEANEKLATNNVKLHSVITLPQFLAAGEHAGLIPSHLVQSYKEFLTNPVQWQIDRNMVIPEASVEAAQKIGYTMRKLDEEEARQLNAPENKLKEGVVYYAKE